MPRAENRKRPPSSLGNVSGSGFRSHEGSSKTASGVQSTQDNKQALLEKMRALQESKKTK